MSGLFFSHVAKKQFQTNLGPQSWPGRPPTGGFGGRLLRLCLRLLVATKDKRDFAANIASCISVPGHSIW